jgi:HSP20 family protein
MTFYLQPYPFARRALRRMPEPQGRTLSVNIREEDDAFILSALVPGLQAEDLNIQVLGSAVSIEGEYNAEDVDFLLNELPRGSFRRVLQMPAEIEADKVEAKIVNGVLTLTLPKAESARPKKIKIAAR